MHNICTTCSHVVPGTGGIDPCVQELVDAINATRAIKTVASCCGHGIRPGNIALADGRELMIIPNYDIARKIDKLFCKIDGSMHQGITNVISIR